MFKHYNFVCEIIKKVLVFKKYLPFKIIRFKKIEFTVRSFCNLIFWLHRSEKKFNKSKFKIQIDFYNFKVQSDYKFEFLCCTGSFKYCKRIIPHEIGP